MKNRYLVMIIILLFLALIGISYAYFSARVSGSESSTTISATSGEMSITFANGSGVIIANEISPSSTAFATKNFTVTGNNSTNDLMNYRLKLVVENNTFSDGAISFTLSSSSSLASGIPAAPITSNIGINSSQSEIILGDGQFGHGSNKIHTYSLKLYFLDDNTDQSGDMNKTFKAHVEIDSIANNIITFTIDGVSYSAENHMNWYSWLNSSYNRTELYTSSSNLILHPSNRCLQKCVNNACTDVHVSDFIEENGIYVLD